MEHEKEVMTGDEIAACRKITDNALQDLVLLSRREEEQLLVIRSWPVKGRCRCRKKLVEIRVNHFNCPDKDFIDYYLDFRCGKSCVKK